MARACDYCAEEMKRWSVEDDDAWGRDAVELTDLRVPQSTGRTIRIAGPNVRLIPGLRSKVVKLSGWNSFSGGLGIELCTDNGEGM